ncbi:MULTISPECIES: spermidine synthase [Asticcacaulis]|uniref:spermidine synthase n=1 Tax=Asticcacaulis TaxID=76890 RepID=UPI001AEAFDDC|nr:MULTISPECIES: fused MFS/spermidine synthase [Asticcacaulis]MBP2159661.1 SAM-dependent methyltransferase [Asticcacaulis solisilvae]MDR6800512.1 SAM-dependent methyltransferase [Asticcacaulis sp. BE141]
MTSHAATTPILRQSPLFAVTVFTSALLVFFVQPMVGKLLLPLLGGAPAVWNTSMAFFQAALLLGYGYAHLLQRLKSFRIQVILHGVLLGLAALSLPLGISNAFGLPDPEHPILWMLGVLTLSIGAPFAILSATAPLVQAWFALTANPDPATGKPPEPYALYAASNLGSLLSLVAYPVLVEPLTQLTDQRIGWSLGYGILVVLILTLGLTRKAPTVPVTETTATSARPSLMTMAIWIGLAAVPSSLMMGVTTYLSTDVASAPFLWVAPLALYLLTFIFAFGTKPLISRKMLLILQAAAACLAIYALPFRHLAIPAQLAVHLLTFFLTALLCHSELARARPKPEHLTLYYLCLSIGGVVGGSFNAFLAPVIFPLVLEYPLALALACLARPWFTEREDRRLTQLELVWLAFGLVDAIALVIMLIVPADGEGADTLRRFLFAVAPLCAFALRDRGIAMACLLVVAGLSAVNVTQIGRHVVTERNFYGVVRIAETTDPVVGPLRRMTHGTTLHGAQAIDPQKRCQPLTYYASETAIGQTLTKVQALKPSADIAVVGLGVGTMAAYVRPSDRLAFFEIDPAVIRLASDPKYFTFVSDCAKGPVTFHAGDARLTLSSVPAGQFDLLTIDAFSSDSVPAHLLTVQAIDMYLSKLKPDGVLLLHLSNRHLELRDPVIAAIRQSGGSALTQTSTKTFKGSFVQSPAIVVIAGRNAAALAGFRADARWQTRDPGPVRAWTDDYTNLIGAMLRHK